MTSDDTREVVGRTISRLETQATLHDLAKEKHSATVCREAAARITRLSARIALLAAQYQELLFAVSMKHEGETRHETALRYIKRAETKGDRLAALNTGANSHAE